MTRGRRSRQIFRAPLVLAAISLIGLIAALLVDGPIDLVWDGLIGLPLVVMAVSWLRRSRARDQNVRAQ